MDEEQKALINFFGTIHAQAKQTDQQIVGPSTYLKPISPVIQNQLEQALRSPKPQPQPLPQEIPLPSIESAPTIPQQSEMQLIEPIPTSISTSVDTSSLVDVLEKINLNIGRLADILEKKPKHVTRARTTKQKNSD